MRHLVVVSIVALLASGCGGDTRESLTQDGMSNMKELVAVLDTVKDAETAKAAKPKLKTLFEKMNTINEKMNKMGVPTEAEMKAMDEKHGKEMEDLQMKMMSNMMKIS